jgi:hypothetical protein
MKYPPSSRAREQSEHAKAAHLCWSASDNRLCHLFGNRRAIGDFGRAQLCLHGRSYYRPSPYANELCRRRAQDRTTVCSGRLLLLGPATIFGGGRQSNQLSRSRVTIVGCRPVTPSLTRSRRLGGTTGTHTPARASGNGKDAPEADASAGAFGWRVSVGSGVFCLLSQLTVKKRMTATVHKAWADTPA